MNGKRGDESEKQQLSTYIASLENGRQTNEQMTNGFYSVQLFLSPFLSSLLFLSFPREYARVCSVQVFHIIIINSFASVYYIHLSENEKIKKIEIISIRKFILNERVHKQTCGKTHNYK